MPTSKETLTTRILVKPEWDKPALKRMEKDFGGVTKRLASMKTDWGQISKSSGSAVAEIARISKAAAAMSGQLSSATKKSVREMAALAKEVQKAKKEAEELKRRAKSASSPEERSQAEAGYSAAEKQLQSMTRQLRDVQKAERANVNEIKSAIKARKLEREALKKAASYTGKDFRSEVNKNMGSAFHGAKGGPRGMWESAKSIGRGVRAGSRYSAGVSARASLSGEGGGVAAIAKLAPVLSGLTVGVAAFLGFIVKASSAISSMNKTLIEGAGTANDFTMKAGAYTASIDDLRKGTKDATASVLKMGGTVETTAKLVNAYMREASGSVIKTRDAMQKLGEGDTARGIEVLAKNAIAYGKALGVEVTEVGGMIGKMENEVGLGAAQAQSLMGNIVKAAATSNMPVFKFMDIFRSTTPALELYTNRMEELTGVIKMLSKNMSAADVKKYMEAFRGFKGQSFLERVQHVLVAGVGQTDKILAEGFQKKADTLAVSLNEQAGEGLGDEFAKAFKKGDKAAMQDVLVRAKSRGAQAATIGEAQKLMGVESDRRAGGALGVASASKGASMRDMAKIMEAELQRLGGGKPGARVSQLKEQIAEQRGWSQEQVDALNQFNDSMSLYQKSLQEYGTTVSRSMDDALKKVLAQKTGKGADQITARDMAKASADDIAAAAELSNKSEKTQRTALDLATENADATVSMGEKLENVVGFLLEKIYEAVSGVLKVLNNIFNTILDWVSGDSAKAKQNALIDKYNVSGYGKAEQEGFDRYKTSLKAGADRGDMAGAAGDYFKKQYDAMRSEGSNASADALKSSLQKAVEKALPEMKDENGMDVNAQGRSEAYAAVDAGDFAKALRTAGISGNSLLGLGQDLISKSLTEEDKRAAAGGPARRAGTAAVKVRDRADPVASDEASDIVQVGKSIKDMGADADKALGSVADSAASVVPQSSPGSPSSSPSSGPGFLADYMSKRADDAKAASEAQQKQQEAQKKATVDVYEGVKDVVGVLKRGIRYEAGFLNGPYAKTLRDSTLSSFKDALVEFGILQAKMQDSPGIRRMMADYSGEVMQQGGSAMAMLSNIGTDTVDPNAALDKFRDLAGTSPKKSMQIGGPVPDTGNYRLHRGEYVVPAVQAAGQDPGQSGGTVNASVIINGSGLTPRQLEGAVYNAMDKIVRRR